MKILKWTLRIIFWLLVIAVLHYTLPQHDIARVTDTYEKRIDPGENRWFWAQADVGTDGSLPNRDVFFIQTQRRDGSTMVYRNEDTGWGWPPYFKFDTANLQAEAADMKSAADNPRWVAIRHYGWRNQFLTIFPNAVGMKQVEGPEVVIIPWMNIAILVVLFAAWWAVRVRWNRWWDARVDPILDEAGDRLESGGNRIKGLFR
ncbi:DUF1523 family protein [Sagittula sp. S175]|uniref:DUF1523 family protein n=1 Tax=Sagittula sp. S175 TaxID=3415129 RepID=UPI003C7BD14E